MNYLLDFEKVALYNEKEYRISYMEYICMMLLLNPLTPDAVITSVVGEYNSIIVFLESLEERGYLKITGNGIRDFSLREEGKDLFENVEVNSVVELASKIREIFPAGIYSGGLPVRSSVIDIADKLRKFLKKHNYTHQQILQATSNYIKRKESENWNYIQRAVYFIEKDKVSSLAAECDGLTVIEKPKMKSTVML